MTLAKKVEKGRFETEIEDKRCGAALFRADYPSLKNGVVCRKVVGLTARPDASVFFRITYLSNLEAVLPQKTLYLAGV